MLEPLPSVGEGDLPPVPFWNCHVQAHNKIGMKPDEQQKNLFNMYTWEVIQDKAV